MQNQSLNGNKHKGRDMVEISICCPHCGEPAKAESQYAGKIAECPSCGKDFRVQDMNRSNVTTPPPPSNPTTNVMPVVVTDIKIPFVSMIVLMVKWSIAAIPAFIILAIIGFVVSLTFAGGCAAMMAGGR